MAIICFTRMDLEDRLVTSRLTRNALSVEGSGEKEVDKSNEGMT